MFGVPRSTPTSSLSLPPTYPEPSALSPVKRLGGVGGCLLNTGGGTEFNVWHARKSEAPLQVPLDGGKNFTVLEQLGTRPVKSLAQGSLLRLDAGMRFVALFLIVHPHLVRRDL